MAETISESWLMDESSGAGKFSVVLKGDDVLRVEEKLPNSSTVTRSRATAWILAAAVDDPADDPDVLAGVMLMELAVEDPDAEPDVLAMPCSMASACELPAEGPAVEAMALATAAAVDVPADDPDALLVLIPIFI